MLLSCLARLFLEEVLDVAVALARVVDSVDQLFLDELDGALHLELRKWQLLSNHLRKEESVSRGELVIACVRQRGACPE